MTVLMGTVFAIEVFAMGSIASAKDVICFDFFVYSEISGEGGTIQPINNAQVTAQLGTFEGNEKKGKTDTKGHFKCSFNNLYKETFAIYSVSKLPFYKTSQGHRDFPESSSTIKIYVPLELTISKNLPKNLPKK